jgi:hypothetical protein
MLLAPQTGADGAARHQMWRQPSWLPVQAASCRQFILTNLRLEAALSGRLGSCSVETISLTPRFNAVNHERTKEKPFKRFFLFAHLSHPAEAGC